MHLYDDNADETKQNTLGFLHGINWSMKKGPCGSTLTRQIVTIIFTVWKEYIIVHIYQDFRLFVSLRLIAKSYHKEIWKASNFCATNIKFYDYCNFWPKKQYASVSQSNEKCVCGSLLKNNSIPKKKFMRYLLLLNFLNHKILFIYFSLMSISICVRHFTISFPYHTIFNRHIIQFKLPCNIAHHGVLVESVYCFTWTTDPRDGVKA